MKKILLFLSLALILSFTLTGCAGDKSEGELSQEQIDQVISNTVSANNDADTCKFDMDMYMTMKVSGGFSPGTMSMDMESNGVMDMVNEAQEMSMTMAMDIPIVGEVEVDMESYIIDEWMYMYVSGEGWMKTQVTPEMWETENQIEQQIELLSTGVVDSTKSEVVDGVDCYKLDITPTDMELLAQMALEQSGTEGIQNWEDVLSSISLDYTLWVAKDSSLLMKAYINMSMELSPENIEGATSNDFEKMEMDMEMEIVMYDYNEPVTIELPSAAQWATEVPSF